MAGPTLIFCCLFVQQLVGGLFQTVLSDKGNLWGVSVHAVFDICPESARNSHLFFFSLSKIYLFI